MLNYSFNPFINILSLLTTITYVIISRLSIPKFDKQKGQALTCPSKLGKELPPDRCQVERPDTTLFLPEIRFQNLALGSVFQSSYSFFFYLPDSFACEFELLAYFFECERVLFLKSVI